MHNILSAQKKKLLTLYFQSDLILQLLAELSSSLPFNKEEIVESTYTSANRARQMNMENNVQTNNNLSTQKSQMVALCVSRAAILDVSSLMRWHFLKEV